MSERHLQQLLRLGGAMVVAVLVILASSVLAARMFDLDPTQTSRRAGLGAMLVLIGSILSSLRLGRPGEERVKGFLVFWFLLSLTFDLIWEIPLIAVPAISDASISSENLPWAIFWWAYTLSDELYTEVTSLVVAGEIWFFLGNLFGAVGLWQLFRGREPAALLLLGLCGALQAYNASFYIGTSGIVHGFDTIPEDWKAQALFWGLNGFWAIAASTASVLSFRLLFHRRGSSPHAGRQ